MALVMYFLSGPSVDIWEAAETGNIEAVKKHLADGVDVNVKDGDGDTPLHYAAVSGRKEVAELLIANGADVKAKNKYGWTPLYFAKTKETADLLRKHGGKGNAPVAEAAQPEPPTAKAGDDSISHAVLTGIEAIKQHLDAGADVNAKRYGWTPLHYAVYYGHKEIAELLIAKSADVNARTKSDGDTPLDFSIRNKHTETTDLLRKHGGKTGEELKALIPRLVQHGRFAFSFDAKEGKVYEVQDSFDLLNWEVIKTYTGTGVSVRFDEERDHDPPKWFYRVRVVE